MRVRQCKQLLRRRQEAAKRSRSARRAWVVTGATFVGVGGLVGSNLSPPAMAVDDDAGGAPVELVADLNPSGDFEVTGTVAWQDSLLFAGHPAGAETGLLWQSSPDGEPSRVFDSPPVAEETIDELTADGDRFFFTAAPAGEADGPSRLWVSDGSDEGTRQLTFADPANPEAGVSQLVMVSGTLVFVPDAQDLDGYLWVSDGTVAGTHEAVSVEYYDPADLQPLGDKVVFTSDTFEENQPKLVLADPATGESAVFAAGPNEDTGSFVGPSHTTVIGDRVFFSNDVGKANQEPWVSDGTARGTHRLADLAPKRANSSPSAFTALAGKKVVFRTNGPTPALYVTNGTGKGTKKVREFPKAARGQAHAEQGASLGDGRALFTVTTKKVSQLWVTDGTKQGTQRLTRFAGKDRGLDQKGEVGSLVVDDGRAWFVAKEAAEGRELWVTDGTPTGTGRVTDNPGAAHGVAAETQLTAAGGRMWFRGVDAEHGVELWRTSLDSAVQSPVVKAPSPQKQPKKNVKVKVRAGAGEHVRAVARGTVEIGGRAAPVRLKKTSAGAQPGGRAKLTLTVGPKHRATVLKALKKKRKVTATVTMRLTDLAGNVEKREVEVRLK